MSVNHDSQFRIVDLPDELTCADAQAIAEMLGASLDDVAQERLEFLVRQLHNTGPRIHPRDYRRLRRLN